MKIKRKVAVAAFLFAGSLGLAGTARAVPAPAQEWNKGCAANGAFIAESAQGPGPNAGPNFGPNSGWATGPDRQVAPGQSIVFLGKGGECHRP